MRLFPLFNSILRNALDADGKKIVNLATPTADADAATKKYVDENSGGDVAGKLPVKPIPKYLHYLSFDDPYKADAEAWYESLAPDAMGGACSAVRRGGKLWRNYDWTFDDAAEFVVRMSAAEGRHASVGVASLGAALTEDEAASGVYTAKYRALPGMTLDGINDAGVVCEINVDGGPKDGWNENGSLHVLAAVRYALDNFDSAEDAAEYIAANVRRPPGDMNFHFMIADATSTYVVENGTAYDETDSGAKVLTNYALFDDGHAGGGKERYDLLADGADISAVNWTNAYQPGNDWHSDFDSPEQHQSAIEQWAAQGSDKEAHRGKTTASGKAWWQSVHTTEYDFAAKTLRVAVQESGEYFTFAAGAKAEVAWGDVKDKPETFPPSAHTHDKIVDGEREVRADLTAKVRSGWTNQWEPSVSPVIPEFNGIGWTNKDGVTGWFVMHDEFFAQHMLGDYTNPDATELTFPTPDGVTVTHRVPNVVNANLLTDLDVAAPSTTADTNAVAGAKATGEALAAKRDKTDLAVYKGSGQWSCVTTEPDGVTPYEPTMYFDGSQVSFGGPGETYAGYWYCEFDATLYAPFAKGIDADSGSYVLQDYANFDHSFIATWKRPVVKTTDTLALTSDLTTSVQRVERQLDDKADEFTPWVLTYVPPSEDIENFRVFDTHTDNILLLQHKDADPDVPGRIVWTDVGVGQYNEWDLSLDIISYGNLFTATRKRVLRTGDAATPQEVESAVAQKRDKTDHVVVPEHWGDFAVGAGDVEPALDGVTPTVAWGEFDGVAGWTITGLANGFEQRFKCTASADATHLNFMVWNDDAESPYYGDSGIIECDLLSERSYLISGLDAQGVPLDPNVAELFSESDTSTAANPDLNNKVLQASVNKLIDAKVGDVNAVLAAALDGTEVE